MKAGGGLITKDDLAKYEAKERKPIHGTYRGYDVYGPPPPSSGGICLIEMLNILENFDLKKQGRYSPRDAAPDDRSDAPRPTAIGRDTSAIPTSSRFPTELTTKEYAAELAKNIDPNKATPSATWRRTSPLPGRGPEHDAFQRHRRGRHGGVQHLHAGELVRLAHRGAGRRLPAEQRDGRLQSAARRDDDEGADRHGGRT